MPNSNDSTLYIKFFAPVNANTSVNLMNIIDQAVNQGKKK